MTASPETLKPRRSPWPYAIGSYFAVVITCIAIFITWAVKQNMDLVRSDYYEQEILFQRHIDAAKRTMALGSQVALTLDAKAGVLMVRVPATHVTRVSHGNVHLYRPSNATLDRHIPFQPDANGQAVLPVHNLASGLWRIRAEWTAGGESYLLENNVLLE